MKKVIIINKQIGETPLEALERARVDNSISKDVPMTYAGRLDPMAEGVLLVLVGDECKKKEDFINFDKEYEVEVLLGIQTDTYDPLGLIKKVDINAHENKIDFTKYICKFTQEYPAYSSKVISMKEVPDILPTKEVEIFSIDLIEEEMIVVSELVKGILEKIEMIKGDFRQKKIVEAWKEFEKEYDGKEFRLLKLRVVCSSGTYMRAMAERMGGLALSIKRTRVGSYTL